MAYRDAPKSSLAFCERHALRYDATTSAGCVVCRRDEPERLGAPLRKRTILWAVLACAGGATALGVGIWRGRAVPPAREQVETLQAPVPYYVTARESPAIRAILAPSEVRVGERAELRCEATQSDGEPNGYKWGGPFGATKESASNVAVWIPARAGEATLTCWARNSVGNAQRELRVVVLPATH